MSAMFVYECNDIWGEGVKASMSGVIYLMSLWVFGLSFVLLILSSCDSLWGSEYFISIMIGGRKLGEIMSGWIKAIWGFLLFSYGMGEISMTVFDKTFFI